MSPSSELRLGDQVFSSGRAKYLDMSPLQSGSGARIWVGVQAFAQSGLEATPCVFLAALDTGAGMCVIGAELAKELGLSLFGRKATLSTAYGPVSGRHARLQLQMMAEEGDSLLAEATFLVAEEGGWPPQLVILGYEGLLQRIRLAIDPGDGRNHIYFGSLP